MRSAPRLPRLSTMRCNGLVPLPSCRSRRSGCAIFCARRRDADQHRSKLTLGRSCIGGDEMRHLRIAGSVEAAYLLLQQTIGLGDALMLAQMLHPAFDEKGLDDAAFVRARARMIAFCTMSRF